MRVSRKQAEENRQRVIAMASSLFRRHGFDGIGIASVMEASGLTHGGFYGNFGSKDELIREATQSALQENCSRWEDIIAANPADPLQSLARFYLSDDHAGTPEMGCFLATLGSDAARKGEDVRRVVAQGIERHVDTLSAGLPQDTDDRRQRAFQLLSLMVGGLVLARAADPQLTTEITAAVTAAVSRIVADETSAATR